MPAVFSSRCASASGGDRLRHPGCWRRDSGGDAGLRGDPSRAPRQVPADQRLHRPPEGRHQHPPHAHGQPAADRAGLAVRHAPPAAAAGLAAVEPHLRRQPQLQHGARAWRQPGDRRGPAGAGLDREDGRATCARCRPNFYFNVPRGFDLLLPFLEQDDDLRERVLRAAGRHLLRGRGAAAEPVGAHRRGGAERARPAAVVHLGLGRHRDGACRHQRALADRPRRLHRRAAARRGAQVRARTATSSSCACAGPTSSPATATRRSSPPRPSTRRATTGSAMPGRLVDPADPCKGVAFDGRVAEDFKIIVAAPGSRSARCA